jgi:hypothetical protein
MRPPQLAEQHRAQLPPTGEASDLPLGLHLTYQALALHSGNNCKSWLKMLHTFVITGSPGWSGKLRDGMHANSIPRWLSLKC